MAGVSSERVTYPLHPRQRFRLPRPPHPIDIKDVEANTGSVDGHALAEIVLRARDRPAFQHPERPAAHVQHKPEMVVQQQAGLLVARIAWHYAATT